MDANGTMMYGGLSPFETVMINEKSSRRASGTAIAGLVLGSVGTAAAIGAWIFGPIVANNRSRGVEALANAQYQATNNQLGLLTNLLAAERNERVAQGTTISQTITDTISGQQSGSQTATVSQTSAIDNTIQNIMQQTLSDAITGKSSLNPTPVSIYSAPSPCGCPGYGCNN